MRGPSQEQQMGSPCSPTLELPAHPMHLAPVPPAPGAHPAAGAARRAAAARPGQGHHRVHGCGLCAVAGPQAAVCDVCWALRWQPGLPLPVGPRGWPPGCSTVLCWGRCADHPTPPPTACPPWSPCPPLHPTQSTRRPWRRAMRCTAASLAGAWWRRCSWARPTTTRKTGTDSGMQRPLLLRACTLPSAGAPCDSAVVVFRACKLVCPQTFACQRSRCKHVHHHSRHRMARDVRPTQATALAREETAQLLCRPC